MGAVALDLLRELRGLAPDASPDPLRPDAADGLAEPDAVGSPVVVDVEPGAEAVEPG